VQRTPLVVYDPSPQADATRGARSTALVEAIDVVPTALQALEAGIPEHRIEGRSLLAHTRTPGAADVRDAVFSELDYSFRQARLDLGRSPGDCQATMVRGERWKYVDWKGLPAQLFDLREDPRELHDLGRDAAYEGARREMRERMHEWRRNLKSRTTVTLPEVERKTATHRRAGVHYGLWDEAHEP
jgi:arylsulfatase A-like enzyme